MSYEYLSLEVERGVAVVTLRRADVLNSFNRDMARELQRALDRAAGDPAVRAVLLTATGRAFCAGQDLAEAVPPGMVELPDVGQIVHESFNPIVRRLRELPKPVVCAVNGVAAGAGANIALACDFVVASENATFIQAFSRIGLVPDSGGTFVLPRLVGRARATALMMLGDRVTAQQAYDWGMIYEVVPDAAMADVARGLAERLAAMPTLALGLIKRLLDASSANDLDAQLELERELQGQAGRSHDYLEGVRAFQEKRQPHFEGR
ncbi:MAG TPA: 2-(1,2-epoxy-1,2-dihydrophenyl)acetyl-CoA isomerase PaaG [Gemmatimonadaceae bacterium]|nr:2-(1,2-epoxy-1,2-dihydrophenyl)acetyl-CoA isomerase PaaG [Gemmatimonadaceae bacterium]